MEGQAALGVIDTAGATVFLKEVAAKSGVHRFTIKTAARELKLRAPGPSEYDAWVNALRPFVGGFEEDRSAEDSMRLPSESICIGVSGDGDDDDSD